MYDLSGIRAGDEVEIAGIPILFGNWLHTTTNTRMFLGRRSSGCDVTVKIAGQDNRVGSGKTQLAAQIKQLRAIKRIVGSDCPFPQLIAYNDGALVQEYIEGSDLATLQDDGVCIREPTANAMAKLLYLSRPTDTFYTMATLNRLDFLARRTDRLFELFRSGHGGRLSACLDSNRSIASALDTIDGWRGNSPISLARPLGLCVHGDFVPGNLVLSSTNRDVTFIDPRGDVYWRDDVPLWDTVIELASFVLFSEIVPNIPAVADRYDSEMLWDSAITFCDSAEGLGIDVCQAWPNLMQELEYFITARLVGFAAISCFYEDHARFPDPCAISSLLPLAVRRVESYKRQRPVV